PTADSPCALSTDATAGKSRRSRAEGRPRCVAGAANMWAYKRKPDRTSAWIEPHHLEHSAVNDRGDAGANVHLCGRAAAAEREDLADPRARLRHVRARRILRETDHDT